MNRLWYLLTALVAVMPSLNLERSAELPDGWLLVCGGAALAGVLDHPAGRWAAILAAGLMAHLTMLTCSGVGQYWFVAPLPFLVLAGARSHGRIQLLLVAAGVLVPLALIISVLAAGPEGTIYVERAQDLFTGLALGGAAALAMSSLQRSPASSTWSRLTSVVIGLVALVRVLLPMPPTSPNSVPVWRNEAAALRAAPAVVPASGPNRARLMHDLRILCAAGIAEAGYAWSSLLLAENADPTALRAACPRGHGSADLGPRWERHIQTGRLACTAIADVPAHGAAALHRAMATPSAYHAADMGALLRLRGDLLVEAGDLETAMEAYTEADAAGDPYAVRDAARAFLAAADGTAQGATEALPELLRETSDALARTWLAPTTILPGAWQAWNAAMDFGSLQPLRRIGMVPVNERGALERAHHHTPPYVAMTSRSQIRFAFRVLLPPPPARQMPGEVRLRFRNRFGFRLTYVTDHGFVTFACAPAEPVPGRVVIILESPACNGTWADITIHPEAILAGPVTESFFQGEFDLMDMTIAPADARRENPSPRAKDQPRNTSHSGGD